MLEPPSFEIAHGVCNIVQLLGEQVSVLKAEAFLFQVETSINDVRISLCITANWSSETSRINTNTING